MLGLKDANDNSCCDYEQRSVVTKPKALKENLGLRKNAGLQNFHIPMHEIKPTSRDDNKAQDGNFQSSISLEEENFQKEKQIEEKIDQENSVTFYNSSEQNENSKAFMDSLGSWINDFFNVPNKNTAASPVTVKSDFERDSVLEEDPEYLKSISAIKEQFRKKLKSETSILVSVPDEPFVFNFDMALGKQKKHKKSTSLPACSTDWPVELDDFEEHINEPNPAIAELVIRTSEAENLRPSRTKNSLNLRGSILVKEKKKTKAKNRHDISELEEYVFPTPAELSKRILLNVNENEKFGQLYKNSQSLGVQEAQHYGQRKGKARQTNARCYTTKANPADTLTNLKQAASRSTPYCTTSASAIRGSEEILRRNPVDIKKCRKNSKKDISDSITFLRMASQKPAPNLTMEAVKGDNKTSSDDLVKYLMKKIKNTRPLHPKSKSTVTVPQLLSTPKNRFMQSATNTLVSVMAKKDNENQSKSVSRVFPDNRINPNKELILKNSEANVRLDVSRAIAANKYSRLSYLLEDNKIEDDGYLFEKGYKNSKRSYEEIEKQGIKKHGSKFNKRQEVKNMLSKIDMKFNMFEPTKARQRKKKVTEDLDINLKEEPNPRFQKQHDLFKTNLKSVQQNPDAESEEMKIEAKEDPENDLSVSTELAVIDKNVEEMDMHSLQEKALMAESSNTVSEEKNFMATPAESDLQEPELYEPDIQKIEKRAPENSVLYKEKVIKPKPLQFFKDSDTKTILSPPEKLYITEHNQKDSSKGQESPMSSSEVGQGKTVDMMLLSRRFPTNTLHEPGPKSKAIPWISPVKTTLFLDDLGKDTNGDKKEAKDKKKVKTPKATGVKDSVAENCGFEKAKKKPGPNCEKDE